MDHPSGEDEGIPQRNENVRVCPIVRLQFVKRRAVVHIYIESFATICFTPLPLLGLWADFDTYHDRPLEARVLCPVALLGRVALKDMKLVH
jgi:hypothetical protein